VESCLCFWTHAFPAGPWLPSSRMITETSPAILFFYLFELSLVLTSFRTAILPVACGCALWGVQWIHSFRMDALIVLQVAWSCSLLLACSTGFSSPDNRPQFFIVIRLVSRFLLTTHAQIQALTRYPRPYPAISKVSTGWLSLKLRSHLTSN
jgi:hypothetical protein